MVAYFWREKCLWRVTLSKTLALTHQKFFPNLFIRKTRNFTFYIAFIYTDGFFLPQKVKTYIMFLTSSKYNSVKFTLSSCFDNSQFMRYFLAIWSGRRRFCWKVAKAWRKYWMVTVTLENSHFCLNFKSRNFRDLPEFSSSVKHWFHTWQN